jgi:hypothetical protein
MSALDALKSVQFLIDQSGRPSAVQMNIEAWESLLDWLEELEDRATVTALISPLHQGPKNAGGLRWSDVRDEWDSAPSES